MLISAYFPLAIDHCQAAFCVQVLQLAGFFAPVSALFYVAAAAAAAASARLLIYFCWAFFAFRFIYTLFAWFWLRL